MLVCGQSASLYCSVPGFRVHLRTAHVPNQPPWDSLDRVFSQSPVPGRVAQLITHKTTRDVVARCPPGGGRWRRLLWRGANTLEAARIVRLVKTWVSVHGTPPLLPDATRPAFRNAPLRGSEGFNQMWRISENLRKRRACVSELNSDGAAARRVPSVYFSRCCECVSDSAADGYLSGRVLLI